MAASEVARETLRRCIEALDFLVSYPMRGPEGPETGPFLETGGGRLVLHPFLVSEITLGDGETYFVDAWDTRKGTARMKSFERGHTVLNKDVAEALLEWSSNAKPDAS